MCGEDGREVYLGSKDLRQGYVKTLAQPWKKVTYANVDGRAIFEGCIILGDTVEMEESRIVLERRIETAPELLTLSNVGTQGIAIKGRQYRWPNRIIPYAIDPTIPNQQRIFDAIKHWEDNTTIDFRPRTTERDYVYLRRVASGCASAVGRRGGRQELILADSCSVGNILHELGHTVGLWHEQSRADRDNFIDIDFANVDPDYVHNFEQHIHDGIDIVGYDYGSIMHYPPRAFSVDDQPTIRPKQPLPSGTVMGQRIALSPGDIQAVEQIYAEEPISNG
jgi:hypothetical protein